MCGRCLNLKDKTSNCRFQIVVEIQFYSVHMCLCTITILLFFFFRFALCKLMYFVFSLILLSANKHSFFISNISVVSHTLKLQKETICSSMLPSEHFPPCHPFFFCFSLFLQLLKSFNVLAFCDFESVVLSIQYSIFFSSLFTIHNTFYYSR